MKAKQLFSTFVLSALVVVLCASMGWAAVEQNSYFWHTSGTSLVDNKPAYDKAHFKQIDLYIDEEGRAATPQDWGIQGTVTIKNGTYSYWLGNTRVDVNNEDKTFNLIYDDGDASYVEYVPYLNNSYIYFANAADGGLQNRDISWTLLGSTHSGTVPNFRTVSQQLATYVPYVEKDSTGRNFSWKMVSSSNMSAAISISVAGRYRVRVFDVDGSFVTSDWTTFNAGDTPSGTYTLPGGMDASKVNRIYIHYQIYENAQTPNLRYRYSWRFDVADRSNIGVANPSVLTTPISMDVNETKEIKITLNPGYYPSYTIDNINSVVIGDTSVLQFVSQSYNESTQEYSVKLKSLKKGSTTFSLILAKDESNSFREATTLPTTVTVGSGTPTPTPPSGSGSSGGCDAGFASGLLLLAGVALLKKR